MADNNVSQLFSAFVSLASEIDFAREDDSTATREVLDRIIQKDLGILNLYLEPVGRGTSFCVQYVPPDETLPGIEKIVLKRSIPSIKAQSEAKVKRRINSMMLELRLLAHDPIRRQPNIVELMGIAWETDPFDLERRWPILLIERASEGTLTDFLLGSYKCDFNLKLSLAYDILCALEGLHACGVVHGDIKLDNVLVFSNDHSGGATSSTNTPFIAKLADFGGVIFDVDGLGSLPSGTQPWNPPEWREVMTADGLLKTDIYSLGLLIWRLLADGKNPFQDYPIPVNESEIVFEKAEILKSNNEQTLSFLMSIHEFTSDINSDFLPEVLASTVQTDPEKRSLLGVRSAIEECLQELRPTVEYEGLATHQLLLQKKVLRFSFFGIGLVDYSIAKQLVVELKNTANVIEQPEAASEASYGLAVLYLNGVVPNDNPIDTGLQLLETAARCNNDRARSVIFRLSKALGMNLSTDCTAMALDWLKETASQGFFLSFEDLREAGWHDAAASAGRILRTRYGGTGRVRFRLDMFPDTFPGNDSGSFDLEIREISERLSFVDPSKYINGFGDTVLHLAATCGLLQTTEYVLDQNIAMLNCTNVNGETPLLLACISGQYEITKFLLEAGADPSVASDYGDTPLHWLISFDSEHVNDIALALCRGSADLNAVAESFSYIHCGENAFIKGTPLMRAVIRNRLDVVIILLEMGADPNYMVEEGSAINLAAFLHYPTMLELLLSKSKDKPVAIERSTGKSLLLSTLFGGSLEGSGAFFQRLRRHGSRYHSNARETIELLVRNGAKEHLDNVPGREGMTALYIAAFVAEADILRILLDNGCLTMINVPSLMIGTTTEMCTPLVAAISARKYETFELLLDAGADPLATHLLPTGFHVTTLYMCAWFANDDIRYAKQLLQHGVEIDKSPDEYETPFGCAIRNRCFQLADFLMESKADINKEYSTGLYFKSRAKRSTLGHILRECSVDSLGCLKFLFRAGRVRPCFTVSAKTGLTALHVIASIPYPKQDSRALALLLDAILTYFHPDDEALNRGYLEHRKWTALHMAVVHTNDTIVRLLLLAGADSSILDVDGLTPLSFARHLLGVFPEGVDFPKLKVSRQSLLDSCKKKMDNIIGYLEKYQADAKSHPYHENSVEDVGKQVPDRLPVDTIVQDKNGEKAID